MPLLLRLLLLRQERQSEPLVKRTGRWWAVDGEHSTEGMSRSRYLILLDTGKVLLFHLETQQPAPTKKGRRYGALSSDVNRDDSLCQAFLPSPLLLLLLSLFCHADSHRTDRSQSWGCGASGLASRTGPVVTLVGARTASSADWLLCSDKGSDKLRLTDGTKSNGVRFRRRVDRPEAVSALQEVPPDLHRRQVNGGLLGSSLNRRLDRLGGCTPALLWHGLQDGPLEAPGTATLMTCT